MEMLVIQAVRHFPLQQRIERRQVHGKPCFRVDLRAHRHFEEIAVAVAVRVGARPEYAAVPFLAPLRPVITMSGRKPDLAR